MLRDTIILETPIGFILRRLHLVRAAFPEQQQDSPWVQSYTAALAAKERPLARHSIASLQENLRRLQAMIESGHDEHHTTAQLYRTYSEIARRQNAQPRAHDSADTICEDVARDIEMDVLKHVKSPDFLPEVRVDGTVICDWYGANDPVNPLNWSRLKKLYVVVVVAACSFVVYVAAPIWTPSEEKFRNEFGTDYEYTVLGLALFVLGYGVGPLLFAPLSEIVRIGRNPPYVLTFPVFMGITVAVALVKNAPAFMFLRFLQGFFGSPILATGGASLADVYSEVTLPYAMTAWAYACFVAPIVGPIVASAAIPHLGWRFSIWEILIASAPAMIMMLFLPETSSPTILYYRANRLRKVTQDPDIRSASEISQAHLTPRTLVIESLLIPMKITVLDPAILFTNVYMMLIYGIYYSFFEAFPLVYGDIYRFDLLQSGLSFIPIALGTTLGWAGYISYLYFIRAPRVRSGEATYPEQVLIPGCVASFIPPIGLFLFGWSANESVHWIVSMVGVALYPMGVYVVFQGLFLYLPLCYPRYAASLFAASDMTRCTFGMAAVLFAKPLYTTLGIGPACSLLAGLMICCIFGILALYKYGPTLRKRSKFTDTL